MTNVPPPSHHFDPSRALIDYVEEIAELWPDAPAILLRDTHLTYRQMMDRAHAAAAALCATGVTPGDFVGLAFTRSADSLIAMLGVLRAGACYVPLDPAYSDVTQLAQIVAQVPFAAILQPTPGPLPDGCGGAADVPLIALSDLKATNNARDWPLGHAEDAACMVFTSGTTGTPKGVMLANRGLAAFTLDQPVIGLKSNDIMLHASSIACDGGSIEVWSALLAGAALAVVEAPRPALHDIAATMTRHKVTVTSQYVGMHNLIVAHHVDAFATVRLAMAGGDVLSPDPLRRLKQAAPTLRMVNIYGPSETTCISIVQDIGIDLLNGDPIPIGRELTHEHAFVVDDALSEVPDGTTGELLIGGAGVALGYYGMPDKTAEVFIKDPRPGHSGRVYRTGDVAMRRADGVFEFFGRADRQIKLGGRRIELDGIEHVFRNAKGVHLAIVEAVAGPNGDKRIGLAVQPVVMPADPAAFEAQLLEDVRQTLHSEFLPRHIKVMQELPVTKMGKPDRKAVRDLIEATIGGSKNSAPAPAATAGNIRATVVTVWDDILGCGPLGDGATFFEAGGTSLQLIDAHARLETALGFSFDLTLFFERPRLGDIVAALALLAQSAAPRKTPAQVSRTAPQTAHSSDIAVIGYAARIPGASTLETFWTRQQEGANLIQRFSPDELEDSDARRSNPNYVPARSVLDDVDMFDARFFNILPREAEKIDPQARVFLEMCVAALDAAACDPARVDGAIGVYAGSSTSTYMLHNLMSDRAALQGFTDGFQIDNYTTLTGNITDTLSSRVAYKLDLKGPAMTVHTACSTGLTAIAQAVTALRAGHCDMALAGGISITFPQRRGYITQEGGMSSPDGLCRPFDADAGGTVFGHGGGVLVLKPLAQALADGDRIEGVIRGVGLTNDGAGKISFTAPSVEGQTRAIRAAQRDAGIVPADVSFIETHGTATPLGDPIEVRALQQVFGDVDHPIALGSVKGSVGHLDAGAGAVSVIRTLQAMKARQIPPMANFRAPSPRIDFAAGPFQVPATLQNWRSNGPRIAGVSGFGVGGTNAHIVLQEAPETDGAQATDPDRVQILPLSAKSPEALAIMAAQLAEVMRAAAPPTLADVAFTLQDGRTQHEHRLTVAAASPKDAAVSLLSAPAILARPDAPAVAFMFPGQGAQYPGMGSGLYAEFPAYARLIDEGCDILAPRLDNPLKPLLTGVSHRPEDAEALKQTAMAQPALFLTQFATARLWIDRGVTPAAVLGHSVGEFAAAAIAGIMSFEAALLAVAARGRLMQEQPQGVMLAVRTDLAQLDAVMTPEVDLAAENAPKFQVVAGDVSAIAALEARLEARGIVNQRLHTSHAFHGRMMDPVVVPLRDELAGAGLKAPAIPMMSAVTGSWMTDAQAVDPVFWADQARKPVRFARAVSTLAEGTTPALLEVGAGNTLSTFAAQTVPRDAQIVFVPSLPDHNRTMPDDTAIAAATGKLWAIGVPVDWTQAVKRGHRKLNLPGTVFMKKRHWVDAPAPSLDPTIATDTLPVVAHNAAPFALPPTVESFIMPQAPAASPRLDRLIAELATMLTDLSGEEIGLADAQTPFLELGFDSLFMGQISQALDKAYGVEVSFRSLLSDYPSIAAVAAHLDATVPPEVAPAPMPAAQAPASSAPQAATPPSTGVTPSTVPLSGDVAALMQSQMQVMQSLFNEQLRVLGQATPMAVQSPQAVTAHPPALAPVLPISTASVAETEAPAKPEPLRFGRAPSLGNVELTPEQKSFAADLAERYSRKFPGSKKHTQENRATHADPRTAAGFRAEWKEMTFPIVATKAHGPHIEDVDGNQLIDLVNGFGTTAFGHAPDFVTEAISAQMARGFPIGPQQDTAGPTARRFAKFVGHDRVTFCNTGSEAVMAAMRLARAVTGRKRIVTFTNDYHGQFDEVLVKAKARGEPGALPIAPGIPHDAVSNMVVLPWADPASLDWIRSNLDEIAAVVVEPVQSRHPELQPVEFVRAIRQMTKDGGAAMVMDEVVTGFRTHARGIQGLWGIEADMATYGKVVGGGMPVGVLAGSRRFMDALDGGTWAFGDNTAPDVAPTFFAGTFVRHPLVVAAVDAVLDHLEHEGDQLWSGAADCARLLAEQMNAALAARGIPGFVTQFSSWFVMNASQQDPRATLLFPLMRMEGVHVLDGFCGFLTTTHGEAECAAVLRAFETAVDALLSVGILLPADAVSVASEPKAAPLPAPVTGPVALTESQREIWMTHQQGDLPAASFNESVSMRIEGTLDSAVLGAALTDLVARHDALRTRFAKDGAYFEITPPAEITLSVQDISGSDPETALHEALDADARQPVDIVGGAPFRTMLYKLKDDLHVLVMTAHHIVCDGWSYNTLFTELAELYSAKAERRAATLVPAPSFAAFARDAQDRTPSAAVRAYWKAQYSDVPVLPDLPTDRPRPARKSFAGATASARIDADLVKRLRKAGAKHGATLFVSLFAGLQITLGRLSGSDQIVLGVPTGGQAKLEDQSLVGHLVNFLPIRADFNANESAATHLARVRDAVGDAFENGSYTLGTLVRDLDIPRTLSRLPVTEVQFNLERVPEDLRFGEAKATVSANPKAAVNFDLFFNVVEGREGLRIDVDYNTDLFDRETVTRWVGHLECVLDALAAEPDAAIASLPLMRDAEAREIAERWNRSTAAYDRTALVQDLIATSASEYADAPAVSDAAGTLTYIELMREADALAALIQSNVTGQSKRIGVSVPRGTGMVVAILAVLKAGHTYVPVDPDLPLARQKLVLDTAQVAAVVAPKSRTGNLNSGGTCKLIHPSDARSGATPTAHSVSAEDAAYVIFTSGSTGTPKGVEIPHRAVVNFLTSMAQAPGLWPTDKLLAVTTISFDIAALELFLPLTVGAEVEIASRQDVLDGFRLVDRLKRGDVTVVQATPTLWALLLEAGFEPSAGLRMLAGGEPLAGDLAVRLTANGATLWNMYGPTETTIWSALSRVSAGGSITIGAPVANTELHVMDSYDRLCAPGQVGELRIGGDGLARGYVDRPDLTEAAFRDVNVAGRTTRLYHTGDLAVRSVDGSLHVLGRRDGQIKLRGFRIELGEIETRLRAESGVSAAAVALRTTPSGQDRLVGYIVGPADTAAVAKALAQYLPDYMVPTAWQTLDALPQTANGKLDRKALPDPEFTVVRKTVAAENAPSTPTEKALAAIWCEVLEIDEISATETIFAMGIDSLAVFRLAARMIANGHNLEARYILDNPTLRELAAFADARGGADATPSKPSVKDFLRKRTGT